MKLIINTPGTYLHRRGECFLMEKGDEKQEVSAKKVDQIMMTTQAALSTSAIELALESNIDIIFLKNTGQPIGRVWHSKLGSITKIRRKQLFLQEHRLGTQFVIDWIGQKLSNQINFLSDISANKRKQELRDVLKKSIVDIKGYKTKINDLSTNQKIEDIRNTIQGYEGLAGRSYFSAISIALPKQYEFNGRSKNPAKDKFNAFLNYSYGILYSSVEKGCIIAGLDPYIGIMHTDNYNKKALVFDIIEMYRGYMDELVYRLFSSKKVKDEHVREIEDGLYLNKEGKQLLIAEYNKLLEKQLKYKGRNIQFSNIIQFDCHNIANTILKEKIKVGEI